MNGLLAKVIGLVPRHQEIVGRILGETHAREITLAIGFAECVLALWILGGRLPCLTAWLQILLVMGMNVLERVYASDLLLWGPANFVFAACFCIFIYLTCLRAQKP